MSMTTKVPWADAAWNFGVGCSEVSPGCKNCWARKMAWRKAHNPRVKDRDAYRLVVRKADDGVLEWTNHVGVIGHRMTQPFDWKKGRKVGVCLESDLFHPAIPERWQSSAFNIMRAKPQHDYIILTKRVREMRKFMGHLAWEPHPHTERIPHRAVWKEDPDLPLPNVCVVASAESDEHLRQRLPWLLDTPAAMRGLSLEPLLGPIELAEALRLQIAADDAPADWLHWVIVGGETGGPPQQALVQRVGDKIGEKVGGPYWVPDYQPRPDALAWVRKVRDDCAHMGIPFYFKGWGGYHTHVAPPLLDGREHRAFPAGFRHKPEIES